MDICCHSFAEEWVIFQSFSTVLFRSVQLFPENYFTHTCKELAGSLIETLATFKQSILTKL